jgi:hypothetical protein
MDNLLSQVSVTQQIHAIDVPLFQRSGQRKNEIAEIVGGYEADSSFLIAAAIVG